jgi:hypothetical protein
VKTVISEELLKNSVKTCLQDQFQQTWHANIDTGSKALNYRLFKNKFEFENFCLIHQSTKFQDITIFKVFFIYIRVSLSFFAEIVTF